MKDKVVPLNAKRDLEQFFDYMYSDQTGYVYSPTKSVDGNKFEQFFFAWPTGKEELVDHVLAKSNTHEVYYGPALFTTANAEKQSFKGTYFVWAEFDGTLPQNLDGIPEPSIRIQSSTEGHQHWYWRLEKFMRDASLVENISQRLTYHLGADLACWNSNRVLRPPGTTHHESAQTVITLYQGSQTASIGDFSHLPVVPVKLLESTQDIGEVPHPLYVINKYSLTVADLDFFLERTIEKGHRSSALAKLGHICVENGMTDGETLALLLNADSRWGKFVGRPDQISRLLGIVNYCRVRHAPPIPEQLEETKPPKDDYNILRVFTYDEFATTKTEIDWIIPGLLHQKGLLLLSGPPGVGKSSATLRFQDSMSKASTFLKWKVERPLKTLFVSMEMPHEELKGMMQIMDIQGNENTLLMPVGSSIFLYNKKSQEAFCKVIEQYQPDGVIFDSLGKLMTGKIMDESMLMGMFDFVDRKLRGEYGMFVSFIHHTRKSQLGNKRPDQLDDLYGSQYIGAAATTAIGLVPQGKEQIQVVCHKLRMAPQFNPFTIKRLPGIKYEVVEGKQPVTLMPRTKTTDSTEVNMEF